MLALLWLVIASGAGLAAAGAGLALELPRATRAGIGLAFGQIVLVWVPFALAAAFDLGARSAGLAALAATGGALAVATAASIRSGKAAALLRRYFPATPPPREGRAPLWVGVLFVLLFAWLAHTHYLLPREDGLYSAGVTWGDLPIHLGLVSRFAHAEGLAPLTHPLYLHGPLTYPFVPDYSVAVLTALGLPLRVALIAGLIVPVAVFLLLLDGVVRSWLGEQATLARALTPALFLLAGGLGFGYVAARWLDGTPWLSLLASVNATYIDPHVLKASHIGNLFVAARTAAYGMPIGLAALLVLGHALEDANPAPPPRGALAFAGLAIGALPLVHSHSFLVLCGALAWYGILGRRWGARWAACAVPLALAALPQIAWLLHWRGPGYVRFAPGFLRPAPGASEWALDIVLGMGLWVVLVPLAVRAAPPRARRLGAPLLALFPLANLVVFTPAVYDNVKLLAWFDVAAAVLVAGLAARLWQPGAGVVLRRGLCALAVLGCTLSGALAVGHELANDGRVATHEDLQLAELVASHTPPSAVIATASSGHDPVAMFSGRSVLLAAPYMLSSHGIDLRPRVRDVLALYAGGAPAREVIARLGVFGAVVGPREREQLPRVNEAFLAAEARAVHALGPHRLYVFGR